LFGRGRVALSGGSGNRAYDFEGGDFATSSGTDPTDAYIWVYAIRVYARIAPGSISISALRFQHFHVRGGGDGW
jgi:hypothetical protein